jgi:hypothetical protein
MQMTRRRGWTTTRAGAVAAIATVAVAMPAAAANADMPPIPPLSQMPAAPGLPPAAAAAASAALGDLPAVLPTVTVPARGQRVTGPTLVGNVINGETQSVTANRPPANSGNVVGAP